MLVSNLVWSDDKLVEILLSDVTLLSVDKLKWAIPENILVPPMDDMEILQ